MKRIITILALFALPVFAQTPTKGVVKTISGNALTESLNVPTGKTLTIDAGANFTYSIGSTFGGSASEFRTDIGAGTGDGSVTSVSVVTANGLSGTVANPSTSPAITLNISGLDAAKIGSGDVSTTEWEYLKNVSSDIQTQFDNKQALSTSLTEISGLSSIATRLLLYTPGAPPNYSLARVPLTAMEFIADKTLLGNNSGLSSVPSELSATTVLDWIGSAQGDMLYRNGSVWTRLPKGTASQVLTMNAGATAPEWAAAGGGASAPLTLASGTITASDPALVITQTWNDGAVVFTGQSSTITRTAAATGSKLFDYLVSGVGSVLSFQYNTGDGGSSPYRLVFGSDASIGWNPGEVSLTIRDASNSAFGPLKASVFNATSGVNSAFYVSIGDKVYAPDNSWDSPHGVRVASDSIVGFSSTTAASGTVGAAIRSGTGSPEGVVTSPVGSLFLRQDGGANTTLYVKESGTGNTGWIAK